MLSDDSIRIRKTLKTFLYGTKGSLHITLSLPYLRIFNLALLLFLYGTQGRVSLHIILYPIYASLT